PLDLMLFLIKDKKLDLFELNLLELANQYIAFLNQAESQKLDIASEYISELAGLIEYKSKRLLPRDKSELDAKDLEDQETDLVRRLIEYQRYKEVSTELADRFNERMLHFTTPVSTNLFGELKKEVDKTIEYDHDVNDLIKAMQKVLIRYQMRHPHDVSIERKELSVEDRIITLKTRFLGEQVVTLDDLLMESMDMHHLIVTFLAVLDMIRVKDLYLSTQNEEVYLKGVI
ncbi:MAG TPA: segregation/condensation protein A, partial [Erysipelothrix sp.]|nr:segregation/condensation protein A [Erysipelothrix sp.]